MAFDMPIQHRRPTSQQPGKDPGTINYNLNRITLDRLTPSTSTAHNYPMFQKDTYSDFLSGLKRHFGMDAQSPLDLERFEGLIPFVGGATVEAPMLPGQPAMPQFADPYESITPGGVPTAQPTAAPTPSGMGGFRPALSGRLGYDQPAQPWMPGGQDIVTGSPTPDLDLIDQKYIEESGITQESLDYARTIENMAALDWDGATVDKNPVNSVTLAPNTLVVNESDYPREMEWNEFQKLQDESRRTGDSTVIDAIFSRQQEWGMEIDPSTGMTNEEVYMQTRRQNQLNWLSRREAFPDRPGLLDTMERYRQKWQEPLAYEFIYRAWDPIVQPMLSGTGAGGKDLLRWLPGSGYFDGQSKVQQRVREIQEGGETVLGVDPDTGMLIHRAVTSTGFDLPSKYAGTAPSTALQVVKEEEIANWLLVEVGSILADPMTYVTGGASGLKVSTLGLMSVVRQVPRTSKYMVKVAGSAQKRAQAQGLFTFGDNAFENSPLNRVVSPKNSSSPQAFNPPDKPENPWTWDPNARRDSRTGDPIGDWVYRGEGPVPDAPAMGRVGPAVERDLTQLDVWQMTPEERLAMARQDMDWVPDLNKPGGAGENVIREQVVTNQRYLPVRATDVLDDVQKVGDVEGMKLIGGGGFELISPVQGLVKASTLAGKHYGLQSFRVGLNKRERIQQWVQQQVAEPFMVPVDEHGTSLGRIYDENRQQIRMVAAAESRVMANILESAFDLEKDGRITKLAGVDPNLFGAAEPYARTAIESPVDPPFIQDVAANLPAYWEYLNPKEKTAMLKLQSWSEKFDNMLANMGESVSPELGRPDVKKINVMENSRPVRSESGRELQGFYVHRGKRSEPGKTFLGMEFTSPDVPIPSGFPNTPSYLQPATYYSMAEGAITRFDEATGTYITPRYSHIREALREYSNDVGDVVNRKMAENFALSWIDEDTGLLIAMKGSDRINPVIRAEMNSIRGRIRNAQNYSKRLIDRSPILTREAKRASAAVKAMERRRESSLGQAGKRIMSREMVKLRNFPELLLTDPDRTTISQMMNMRDIAQANAISVKNEAKDLLKIVRSKRMSEKYQGERVFKALDDLEKELDEMALTDEYFLSRPTYYRETQITGGLTDAGTSRSLEVSREGSEEVYSMGIHIRELESRTDDMIGHLESLNKQLDTAEVQWQAKRDVVDSEAKLQSELRREMMGRIKENHTRSMMQRDIDLSRLEQKRLNRILSRETEVSGRALSKAEQSMLDNDLKIEKVQARLDGLQEQSDKLIGTWQNELRSARKLREGEKIVDLPGMRGYFWPDALANAANKYLIKDPDLPGKQSDKLAMFTAFNSLYRAARGTLDNSAMFVHLLLRFYSNPNAWQRAMRLSLQAWGVPLGELGVVGGRGETAISAFFRNFDDTAHGGGRLGSREWASHGLAITGSETEFMVGDIQLPKLGAAAFSKAPILRNANRAFGAAGDAARLEWADDYLQSMLKHSTMEEIVARGDLEKIAKGVNAATGWSANRAGGSLGDLVLFAPRFLASRFETLANAVQGLPGAATATSPLGKYGIQPGPDKQIATRSMLKMVGIGAMLTFGANEMQGQETDFRPVIKIHEGTKDERWIKNPNFARIRTPWGTDISLFGTWDGLLALMITSALVTEEGGPHKAVRGMASGTLTNIWDLFTGSDGIGNPVGVGGESTDWGRLATYLLGNFVPFLAEDTPNRIGATAKEFREGNLAHGVGRVVELVGWEAQGGKVAPMSLSEERSELRQDRGQDLLDMGYFDGESTEDINLIDEILNTSPWEFGSNFRRLPMKARRLINDSYAIDQKTLEIEQRRRERGNEFQSYIDDKREVQTIKMEQIERALREANPGTTDPTMMRPNKLFRDKLRDIRKSAGLRYDLIEAEYPDMAPVGNEIHESILDQAYTEFNAIFADPALQKGIGEIDYNLRDSRVNALEAKYGKSIMEAIEEETKRNDHPAEKALKQVQETLRPYWEVTDTVADSLFASNLYTDNDKAELRKLIKAIDNNDPTTARYIRLAAKVSNIQIISHYDKTVGSMREWMRSPVPTEGLPVHENASEIDAALIMGDYSRSPNSLGGLEIMSEAIVQGLRQ